MLDWLNWIAQLENSKTVALVLFFVVFCLILLYVYTGRKRSARLESYKYIPLDDDDADQPSGVDHKVKEDGRGEDDKAPK